MIHSLIHFSVWPVDAPRELFKKDIGCLAYSSMASAGVGRLLNLITAVMESLIDV